MNIKVVAETHNKAMRALGRVLVSFFVPEGTWGHRGRLSTPHLHFCCLLFLNPPSPVPEAPLGSPGVLWELTELVLGQRRGG